MHQSAKKGTNLDGPMAGGLAEYKKFSGWPELKEALMAGKIQAAYMLAPMVMDLADKGVPVKIVGLRAPLGGSHYGARRTPHIKRLRTLRGNG